jgi:cell division protein FtsZ
MTLNLTIPQTMHTDFTPRITVIGVGGGGTNAVDNMIALNLQGVDFVVANTDAQQLMHSRSDRRIQLGPHITQGLGAGANPQIVKAAAEEAAEELYRHLDGTHLLFVAAGMGGGTGTGAAPVIARMARERGILTVGVVTKPFTFEGSRRARHANEGIEELQNYVDTLIVIPNQNLFRMSNERTTWKEAFKMADHVLYMGVRGVTDLMMTPGLVNLDFADVRTVMQEMGKAMMGTGEAEGENRAIRAAEAAISNPLLEDTSMSGARGLLINITGGEDLTLFEVDQAATRIGEEVAPDANIIFGSALDPTLEGKIRVSVVATGIDMGGRGEQQRPTLVAVGNGGMEEINPIPLPNQTHTSGATLSGGGTHSGGTGGSHASGGSVTQITGFRELSANQPHQPAPARETQGLDIPRGAETVEARPALPAETARREHPQAEVPLMPREEPAQRPRHATSQAAQNAAAYSGQSGGHAQTDHAPQPQRAPTSSLFNDAPRPSAAPVSEPVARPNLFVKMTGLLRRGGLVPAPTPAPHAEQPAPYRADSRSDPRMEPHQEYRQDPRMDHRTENRPEMRMEQPRPTVRQSAGEEAVSDVPAFLRRQTS